MNITLAGMACGQILTLFEFAFRYPESEESKTRGQQLEELEHHFIDDEPPTEEDTISKTEDKKEAATQFDPDVPRTKKHRFGQCRDELKDLVPLDKAMPIIPSTSVKLSETGVPRSYYSDREASEGQSIYRCLLTKPGTETPCSYYAAQMAAVTTHLRRKHLKLCLKFVSVTRRAIQLTPCHFTSKQLIKIRVPTGLSLPLCWREILWRLLTKFSPKISRRLKVLPQSLQKNHRMIKCSSVCLL